MLRILTLALAGTTVLGFSAGPFSSAEAAPLPAPNAVQVGGPNATVDQVRYRGGYGHRRYGHRGGYGYRRNAAGAALAGAALGLIGGAIAAGSAPRYGYEYGYGDSYDGGYPAYGYGGGYGYRPVYDGYADPAYGYGSPGYGW